ncbi:HNH endonuclease signature motif containing protein, partial [Winogradskya humida]|uniref:HNH endonuclease signature motif containing protein n=2 Tax=Winogradskya humida TaxID=113566 RepID=UPI0027DAF540
CANMVVMVGQVQQLGDDAAVLAAAPLWQLTDASLTDALRLARRAEQAVLVLQARLVHEAADRDIPAHQGHRSTAGWLRSLLLLDPQQARDLVTQATAIHDPSLQQVVLDGQADVRQAAVIASTLDAIPDDLAGLNGPVDSAQIMQDASQAMIDLAGQLPAYQLRRVGERILDHVAPEVADRADQAALTRHEARAQQRRGLTLSMPLNGMVRISGLLGAEDAAVVHAALHPLCQPDPKDNRTPAQQRVDALTDICRLALRTTELPIDGGEPPQLSVTVAYDPLTQTLGAGTTDTGQRLSPETVRRLACDARILPIILGGQGQILNAGRRRRNATGAIRRALHIRDRGCTFPGCDRPPRWTDGHHIQHWSHGGPTNLDNLALLCRQHHQLIHDPTAGWQIRLGPDRRPDFIPPPDIDPSQQPQRNLYHQRQ